MLRVYIEFDRTSYDVFVGGSIAIPISERQAAFIQSTLWYMTDRRSWDEMTDSQWESLEAEIAEILEVLSP